MPLFVAKTQHDRWPTGGELAKRRPTSIIPLQCTSLLLAAWWVVVSKPIIYHRQVRNRQSMIFFFCPKRQYAWRHTHATGVRPSVVRPGVPMIWSIEEDQGGRLCRLCKSMYVMPNVYLDLDQCLSSLDDMSIHNVKLCPVCFSKSSFFDGCR
jgi:hypothetical protein